MSDGAVLVRKLGYRPGTTTLLWRVPSEIGATLGLDDEGNDPAFLLAFAHQRSDLLTIAAEVAPHYRRGGHLWIAYPKKSGRIASDLTRDHGWEPIAALGLRAVTQIAIDGDWSALRYRYRNEIKPLKRRSEQPRDS